MKAKDIVVVVSATQELQAGKVLVVSEVLGSDGVSSWYRLTDGARDYIVYGANISLSVSYNVSEE